MTTSNTKDLHESKCEFKEYHISIPVLNTSYLLQGRLCIPSNNHNDEDKEKSEKDLGLVVILHGFLGHKDYCYQKQLAHDIPQSSGFATIRFDFMGCGDSYPPVLLSRTIQNDIRDLDSMLEWIRNYNRNVELLISNDSDSLENALKWQFVPPTKQKLVLKGGVGHSRGSHALLAWSVVHALASPSYQYASSKIPEYVKNLKYHVTPGVETMDGYIDPDNDNAASPPLQFLVSCSGRYRTSYLMESYENRIPDFKQRGGEKLSIRRPSSKKIEDSWVSYDEIVDLSDIPINKILDCLIGTWGSVPPDLKKSRNNGNEHLPTNFKYILSKFLLVYGEADHIVPVVDGHMYNSHFQRAILASQYKIQQAVLQTSKLFRTLTNNPYNTKTADGKEEKVNDWEYYWDHQSKALPADSNPADNNKSSSLIVNGKDYTPMKQLYFTPLEPSLFQFVLIPNADHNFYGKPREYIVPKEKKANYNPQVVSSVVKWMNAKINENTSSVSGWKKNKKYMM